MSVVGDGPEGAASPLVGESQLTLVSAFELPFVPPMADVCSDGHKECHHEDEPEAPSGCLAVPFEQVHLGLGEPVADLGVGVQHVCVGQCLRDECMNARSRAFTLPLRG